MFLTTIHVTKRPERFWPLIKTKQCKPSIVAKIGSSGHPGAKQFQLA